MDAERWERVQALFHTVSQLPEREHITFLKAECGSDEALMNDVLAMLEEDSKHSGVLDRGLEEVAGAMMADPAVPSEAYKEIGSYRVQRVLGEGGMGTVFLAERADLGSVAAIKILHDAWISPARRKRFAQEQRTLAQLDHPNIARLLDADTLPDGTPFFVMEYVDGVPLDKYCDLHECSIPRRLELFRSVCEAVQFAHRHAIIHRDLKPSNILVKQDGTVKLLDFGIAKHMEGFGLEPEMTRTGLRLLTPAYASPEQMRGDRAAIAMDVYSLGVILYQLLTGRLPFDLPIDDAGEAVSMLAERDPAKPSSTARQALVQSPGERKWLAAGVASWADLDVLCMTAMHRDVEKRYASTEALIRDIDHYLRGEPLEARPDTVGYRVGKFVRRRRRGVAAGAAALVTIAGLVAYFTIRLASERNAALAEAARTQRIQQFMLNLFQGGDEEAGPEHDLRVTTLIERGAQEARALEQDPVVQAELYQTLGDLFQKLGDLEKAEGLFDAALERRRSLPGSTEAVAESLVSLGLLRVDQARLDDGERLVREGLEMSRGSLPPGHPTIAAATSALGKVLVERGEYEQAIPVIEEAVRLRSGPETSRADHAASLLELANAYFYSGRYDESETVNRRVLAMMREIYGEGHPNVADVLTNLGAIQHDRGNYREAERLHREALTIVQSFYGEDHSETASRMTMIARALIFQKRSDEAIDLLRQALQIQERVYGSSHPAVASTLNEIGNTAVARDRFDEAKAAFERVVAIYREAYGGKHYFIGIGLANLGSVHLAEQDYVDAERLFREALAMYAQTLPPDHLNTAVTRIKLGRALLRQKRYAEAEAETSAGYRTLSQQVDPSVSWLNSARTDLVELYDALRQSDKAAAFREEQALIEKEKAPVAGVPPQ